MPITPHAFYGNLSVGTVQRQSDAVVQSDPTGLASTVEVYIGRYTDIVNSSALALAGGGSIGRAYLSPHPDFPSLLAYGVKIKRGQGVLNGTLTIEYRGLDPALSYPPPPIYTIEETTGNEPLSTHPLWVSQIAGTPTAPLNGAQFVSLTSNGAGGLTTAFNPGVQYPGTGPDPGFTASVATFHQFLPNPNGPADFTGISDYLAAGCIFKSTYTSYDLPDISQVGTFSDPDGPAPNLPDGYDWFYVGVTSEDNAGLYRNEATWKAVPTSNAAQIMYGGA